MYVVNVMYVVYVAVGECVCCADMYVAAWGKGLCLVRVCALTGSVSCQILCLVIFLDVWGSHCPSSFLIVKGYRSSPERCQLQVYVIGGGVAEASGSLKIINLRVCFVQLV